MIPKEDPETLELYETAEGYYRIVPPPEEDLDEYYSETYYKEDCATYKHEYSEEKIERFLGKVDRVIRILGKLFSWTAKDRQNCLEIGSGEGWGLRVFRERGWDVTGVDFTSYPCSIHNPELEETIITGSIYNVLPELIRQGKTYQVVYFDNLLEHVRDPVLLLEHCRKLVKPDGVMIIEVPNANSIYYQWLFEQGLTKWRMGFVKYPDHLAYFSIDSLRTVCSNAGFEELAIIDIGAQVHLTGSTIYVIDKFLESIPFEQELAYHTARANIGLGAEMLGFWRPG